MVMKTRVVNLSTKEERIYSLDARESVIAAWESEQGNNNTWTYANSRAPLTVGTFSIAAGDWCAMRNEQPGECGIAMGY